MKKKLMISTVLLLLSAVAGAQESVDERGWSLTPMAGMTVSTLVGDDATDVSASLAWTAGAEASWRMSRLASLDFGAHYVRNRVKSSERGYYGTPDMDRYFVIDHVRMANEYISIPVMVGLHPLPGLTLKAGLQASLLLSAHTNYHITGSVVDYTKVSSWRSDEVATLPRIDIDEDSSQGVKSQMCDYSFEIPVGVSYEWQNVVLDARYHFGLGHVNHGGSSVRRYLQLSLGYRLPL